MSFSKPNSGQTRTERVAGGAGTPGQGLDPGQGQGLGPGPGPGPGHVRSPLQGDVNLTRKLMRDGQGLAQKHRRGDVTMMLQQKREAETGENRMLPRGCLTLSYFKQMTASLA